MTTTLSDIESNLASRLGENSIPYDANEKNRRLSFINRGRKQLLGDTQFWFLNKRRGYYVESDIVLLDDDIREVKKVTIDGHSSPFSQQSNKIYLARKPAINEAKIITSLTSDNLIATATCDKHGLKTGEFALIRGSNQPQYLGAHEVIEVSENEFKFEISQIASEATGNITLHKCNVVFDCSLLVKPLVASTDLVLIPDDYANALDAYAYFCFNQTRGKRASAQDGLAEFNSIREDLRKEHMRRIVNNRRLRV